MISSGNRGLPLQSLSDDIRRELFEFVANGFAEKCEAITTILAEDIREDEMRIAFVQNVKGALLNGDKKADVLLQTLKLVVSHYAIPEWPGPARRPGNVDEGEHLWTAHVLFSSRCKT